MKLGKVAMVVAVASLMCAVAGADEMKMPAPPSNPVLDQLKSLSGSWEGKTGKGDAVKVSYDVISNGNCVMETLSPPDGASMVTMYHLDGNKLVMDHYCSLNNVPHMKATAGSNDKEIDFSFINAANLTKPGDMHRPVRITKGSSTSSTPR